MPSSSRRNPWKFAFVATLLAGAAALLAAQGQQNRPSVLGVCASDRILYRVYDDGRVDYLVTEKIPVSTKGAADWAPLPIDNRYTRDVQGNVVPKK